MLFSISPLKVWSWAIGLLALDYLLIMGFLGATPAIGVDQSTWDFRIAELRSIDAQPKTAVAGVSVSRTTPESDVMEDTTSTATNPIHPITYLGGIKSVSSEQPQLFELPAVFHN